MPPVWLVLASYAYDGDVVERIFANQDAAEEYRDKREAESTDERKYLSFTVEQHEVFE